MKVAAIILAVLVLGLGLFVFVQHEEIRALRGQRDRAVAACDPAE